MQPGTQICLDYCPTNYIVDNVRNMCDPPPDNMIFDISLINKFDIDMEEQGVRMTCSEPFPVLDRGLAFDGVDDWCDLWNLVSPSTFTLGLIIRPQSGNGTLMATNVIDPVPITGGDEDRIVFSINSGEFLKASVRLPDAEGTLMTM